MSIMSSFLIVKFTDNGSGFLLFFAKKWVTYAHIFNVVFCCFFFVTWVTQVFPYDSCPHPPLPTFMNGCLQIIKVGVTFRGVLDQGLDSKIEAWDWNIVLWYSGDRQACSPLGIFWLLEVYWVHFLKNWHKSFFVN